MIAAAGSWLWWQGGGFGGPVSDSSARRYFGRIVDRGSLTRPHDMTIILVMPETLPLAEIKARLSEIVDRVEREHERVVLTRNGRPAAVIMSPADLEALEDTLDMLSDPQALEEIRTARREIGEGRVVSAEELRARYLQR